MFPGKDACGLAGIAHRPAIIARSWPSCKIRSAAIGQPPSSPHRRQHTIIGAADKQLACATLDTQTNRRSEGIETRFHPHGEARQLRWGRQCTNQRIGVEAAPAGPVRACRGAPDRGAVAGNLLWQFGSGSGSGSFMLGPTKVSSRCPFSRISLPGPAPLRPLHSSSICPASATIVTAASEQAHTATFLGR